MNRTPRARELWRRFALETIAWSSLYALWGIWFLSLWGAALLLFLSLDEPLSSDEAMMFGAIQATWVAAIPTALMFVGHFRAHGWTWPRWRIRWVVMVAAAALWCVIFSFWIAAAATD